MGYCISLLSKTQVHAGLGVCEALLLVSALIVVIGLWGEYRTPSWNIKYDLFTLLVAIGCAGELIADGGVFLFSHRLEIISDAEVRDAVTKAGNAKTSADSAAQDAGRAKDSADKAETHLAEADERAERAEKIATDERLARFRIEQQIAGWNLDAEKQAKLITELTPYKQSAFWLSANPSESNFTEMLDGILIASGWVRHKPPPTNPIFSILLDDKAQIWWGSGIHIELLVSQSDPLLPKAAEALVKGLISAGIPAKGHAVRQGLDPGVIHIAIGKRE